MGLCDRALVILQEDPETYLSAAEVARRADGAVPGAVALRRWDHALLHLVESDCAFPRNDPRQPRAYRLRVRP